MIEKEDTVEVLDKYGLMQGSKDIPIILPEFAIKEMKICLQEFLFVLIR